MKYFDIIVFASGVLLMGAGIALKDPAIALAIVGATVAATVIGVRIFGKPKKAARKEKESNEPTA